MNDRFPRLLVAVCCAVALAGALAAICFAASEGPPLPFHDPKVKVKEALALVDKFLTDKKVDLSQEQYICSVVLKHRDSSSVDRASDYHWEIRWKMKPPKKKSPPKQKKVWYLEVSMDGKVYEGS